MALNSSKPKKVQRFEGFASSAAFSACPPVCTMYCHAVMVPPAPTLRAHLSSTRSSGFTLTEISIALGVITVAVISMLASAGDAMRSARSSMDLQVSAQVAQRIINELQLTDFETMIDSANLGNNVSELTSFIAPKVNAPAIRYFDQQGLEVLPEKAGGNLTDAQRRRALYHVLVRIAPRVGAPRSSERNGLPRVTEPQSFSMAMVTVEVARNTSGRKLEIESADKASAKTPFAGNRFVEQAGLQIYRHQARIARTY